MLLCHLFAFNSNAASIQVLGSCNTPLVESPLYTVLNGDRNTLAGWSHIDTEKPNGEYTFLALNNIDYQISKDHYQSDESCDYEKVQNAILVAKLSDWTHQHSNGFETILDSNDISFDDLANVVIDLRVNSSGTRIVEQQTLRERYQAYLTAEQFTELDQGKINLGITLFEKGANDQSTESFNLEYFLQIDQAKYFDRWLRVTVPIVNFRAYTEKGYQGISQEFSVFSKTRIHGFRITPESSYGKQLRNLIGDRWHEQIPETFKEMSISLRRIEFLSAE